MAVKVGTAYLEIVPSAKGFSKNLQGQIAPPMQVAGAKAGTTASKGFGSKFASGLGSVLKVGAKGVAIAAGGILGAALFKGFERLKSIDQARAKLSGLGKDTKTVDKIMQNALASVKGTAFGLGDAATVSAAAVAAGIKPGQQLTKTLKLVADAATIGGTSLNDMGAIFNKVAASNKIQGDTINQLNDKGIPIIQLLGKQLGVSSTEVTKLASKGKIDFKTFQAAMESGLGGAALKSGNTFTGALANVGASLGRIGAGLEGGLFPHLAPAFAGITKALTPLEGKSKGVGDAIGKFLGPRLEQIGPLITKLTTGLGKVDFSHLSSGSSGIGKSFKEIGASLKGVDFSKLKDSFGKGVSDSVSVFAVVVGFLAKHLDTLAKLMPELLVAYATFKTAQAAQNILGIASIPIRFANTLALFASAAANRSLAAAMGTTNTVENAGIISRIRATAATIASTVAGAAAATGARIWAGAQWLLNAAMTANPIGLVVAAIVLLVAGLIYAYKNSETFRNIVNGAFKVVAAAASFMWNNVLKPTFRFIINAFLAVAGAIINGAARAFGWVPGIGPKLRAAAGWFNGFRSRVNAQLNGIKDRNVKVTAKADLTSARTSINQFIKDVSGRTAYFNVKPKHGGIGSLVGNNAAGTNNWRGGPTWVGERGPEILNLPRGSQIIPNHRTAAFAGGGNTFNLYETVSADALARKVARIQAFAGG